MFSTAGIRLSRGLRHTEPRRIGLSHFSPTLRTSGKKSYRKGVVFATVAILVIISGVMITVLGFLDVFDSGFTMMGMLMIAVSVLMFLGALRMFLIASKLRKAERTLQISRGTVASMVIEREDERGTLTVVMDTVNIEARCHRRSNDSNRPPDYIEATSDYYPESASEIVIDTVNSDPPPPYGPPTYDQVVAEKEIELSSADLDDMEEGTSEDQCDQEPAGETEHTREPEPYISHGYQDMPSVTI